MLKYTQMANLRKDCDDNVKEAPLLGIKTINILKRNGFFSINKLFNVF